MVRSEIAIVIPAYNEEKTIKEVIENAQKFGDVIVIDDTSTDGTKSIALKAGAIVVSHESNLGYDGSLNTGFKTAQEQGYKYVVTMDADGQHSFEVIGQYIDYLKTHDYMIVLGVRPQKARFSERLMGLYCQCRFGIKDILCGMKGYNMKVYLENNGFDHGGSIGTELAFMSVRRRNKFIQMDVPIKPRQGKSRFGNILKSNFKILKALFFIFKLDIIGN